MSEWSFVYNHPKVYGIQTYEDFINSNASFSNKLVNIGHLHTIDHCSVLDSGNWNFLYCHNRATSEKTTDLLNQSMP